MKHIVRKAYFDFEKEENFLNQMSANGLALTDYSWCKYVFEDAPKGEYIYRLELLKHPLDHQESKDYINFMEEMGAELVASYNRWVYFRKKASDGEFTIYSDTDSKLNHYKRIMMFFWLILGLNLLSGLYNLIWGNYAVSIGVPAINIYAAIVSLTIVLLILLFLIVPLSKKIDNLNKERQIRE